MVFITAAALDALRYIIYTRCKLNIYSSLHLFFYLIVLQIAKRRYPREKDRCIISGRHIHTEYDGYRSKRRPVDSQEK